jgi:hypothetical protein
MRSERAIARLFHLRTSRKRIYLKQSDPTRRQNPKEARRSAELSLTPESHLDEKVRSAETIEREQREQLDTFESMLRKTKVNLRYAMMRRSKKFYSMSRQCKQLRRCSSSQLR